MRIVELNHASEGISGGSGGSDQFRTWRNKLIVHGESMDTSAESISVERIIQLVGRRIRQPSFI